MSSFDDVHEYMRIFRNQLEEFQSACRDATNILAEAKEDMDSVISDFSREKSRIEYDECESEIQLFAKTSSQNCIDILDKKIQILEQYLDDN